MTKWYVFNHKLTTQAACNFHLFYHKFAISTFYCTSTFTFFQIFMIFGKENAQLRLMLRSILAHTCRGFSIPLGALMFSVYHLLSTFSQINLSFLLKNLSKRVHSVCIFAFYHKIIKITTSFCIQYVLFVCLWAVCVYVWACAMCI